MKNTIICIGREYGSGGREIGEKLAERLHIPCYDKLLLKLGAEQFGINESRMREMDEKPPASLFSGNTFADADTAMMMQTFYSESEQTTSAVRATMEKLASEQSCIIIGRCALSFLKDYPVLSVFIYAEKEDCIRRIMNRNQLSYKDAEKRFKQVNKMRKRYFDFYSDTKWGEAESYDFMLSTSALGVNGCVELIANSIPLKKEAVNNE